jgi:ADP-dependent NAD(P)H-hydrate dehydratase / NAD(P)H-hydrate epimerase
MIPLFTPQQVRAMDERTIAAGTPSLVLMERAAGHLARTVLDVAGAAYGSRVALVCGKGNNGGDGIAAARLLRDAGAWPVVCLVADPADLSGDAAAQLRRWRARGGRTTTDLRAGLSQADVVVDCLLGTGATGAPRPPYDAAIAAINAVDVPVVACDLPSGVDADTGMVVADAVRADVTLCLGAHKRGLALWPARSHVGDLAVGEIGIRDDADHPAAVLVDADDVAGALTDPDAEGDKRSRGVVVIVAGSSGMSGAAVLAARGALAAGAGLVTVATTTLARHFVAPNVPEAMTVDLPDNDSDTAFERIAAACERAGALVMGPGMGHDDPQVALVRRCVASLDLPTVLDADGLNAFRDDAATLARHAADVLVLTPHRSELTRICGSDADDMWDRRVEVVPGLARDWRATIVAKGPGTLVAAPDGRVWVDAAATAALATGGTGDVLAGMTGAALAAGPAPERVAATVTLHGVAGQEASARRAVRSVTSLDVARAVPVALRRVQGGSA